MKTGLTISGTGHVAVLAFAVLTFVARPYHVESTESLPVDVISSTDFSQLTKGAPTAPQVDQAKPVAEKVGEPVPVDDPTAKVGNKEVKAATDTPPVLEPKPPEPKAKKPAQPSPSDPIADALKKDEQQKKPDQKKVEAKTPPQPKKPDAQPFDPRQVEALLDKRDPERVASAGGEVNETVAKGVANGTAAVISQSELDALRARLARFWNPPAAKDPKELIVEVEIKLNPDGTLASPPMILSSRGNTPLYQVAQATAAQAVMRAQPFKMLKPEHYEQWKDIIITFDPQQMFGGG